LIVNFKIQQSGPRRTAFLRRAGKKSARFFPFPAAIDGTIGEVVPAESVEHAESMK
jgi:hypothetical protein